MAGMTIKADLQGLDAVLRRMERLKQSTRGRISRKAVGMAARPLAKSAKAKARRRSGLLAKSIGYKVKTYKNSGATAGIIGPRRGFIRMVTPAGRAGKRFKPRKQDPNKYAHLVEKGRVAVRAKKKRVLSDGTVMFGVRVAPARPFPFIRSAWTAGKAQAEATIARVCGDEIQKEAAKR